MTNWTTPVKSLDATALTWNPPQFGEVIDFEEIRSEFVVQYVVDYQSGDNFLVYLEGSLDGDGWYELTATRASLATTATAAGTSVQAARVAGPPARFVRAVGDNRNTGGSPVATAFIASAA